MRANLLCVLSAFIFGIFATGPVNAITLDEYGVTLVSNGLIDNQSGLQWLDAALTEGTTADLEPFFADGWRLATEQELFFLLTRVEVIPPNTPGGRVPSYLEFSDYLILLDALSIPSGGNKILTPWLCRVYSSNDSYCNNSAGPTFVSFFLLAEPAMDFPGAPDALTDVTFIPYISEAYLYGTFYSECLDCISRSLLVRVVPLPAAFWFLLSAVVVLPGVRRGSKTRDTLAV